MAPAPLRTPTEPPPATLTPPVPPGPAAPPEKVTTRRPIERPGLLLLLAVVGGIAVDVGFRASGPNLVITLGLLAAVAVVATRPGLARAARSVVLAATLPAAFLAVWTSPWLFTADLLAALGLGVVAVAYGRGGDIMDTTIARGVVRVFRGIGHGLRGIVPLASLAAPPGRGSSLRQTVGAVLLALPRWPCWLPCSPAATWCSGALCCPTSTWGRPWPTS